MIRYVVALALVTGLPGAVSAAPAKAAAIAAAAERSKPRAEGAWVRLSAVPGRPSAGYLTVKGGRAADRLTGVTAPGARIEMHSMSMAGGIMKMAKLKDVAVPAGGKAAFAPGGNHLMIFDLAGTPKSLPLTLAFASGTTLTIDAPVRAAGSEAPKAGDHGGH